MTKAEQTTPERPPRRGPARRALNLLACVCEGGLLLILLAWLLGRPGISGLVIGARTPEQLGADDFLDVIQTLGIEPRILYPNGYRRVNRFAFVIHPLSQQYLTKTPPLDWIANVSPPTVMNLVEKAVAYTPPFIYSKVSGIKSPTGDEAEGWLITVGGTPKEIMAHGPEFTYSRLLAAAKLGLASYRH